MAKPYKEVIKESEMALEIDLTKIFGTKARFTEEFRQAFANEAIKTIVERTQDGRPLFGNWRKYSEAYKNSLEFQAFGKDDQVNLTLRGDMLGTLSVLESTGSKVVIGWDDPTQTAKAFNHHTGDTVPKRPFFGLQNQEINELKSQFKDDAQSLEPRTRRVGDLLRALETINQLEQEEGIL